MACNLAKVSLDDALDVLCEEGYENLGKPKFGDDDIDDDYSVLVVLDGEINRDAKYMRDYGYLVEHYNNIDSALSYVGCIFCGGMYTAIGLYHKGKPIFKEHIVNMCSVVPYGSDRCRSDSETDEDEDEDEDERCPIDNIIKEFTKKYDIDPTIMDSIRTIMLDADPDADATNATVADADADADADDHASADADARARIDKILSKVTSIYDIDACLLSDLRDMLHRNIDT